jgi:hypothetical protein
MALYDSGKVAGLPSPSDVFKYLPDVTYSGDEKTFGSGASASFEFGLTDARFLITANESGTAGNAITFAVVNPAENDYPLTVFTTYATEISDTDQINFVVKPATNGSGVITSTANDVIAAVNADAVAKLYVTATRPNGAGTLAVVAVASTNLAGGTAGGIHYAGEVTSTNSVTGMTGQYVVGGANGTGTINGVLYDSIDATQSEKTGLVIGRGDCTVLYENLILPSNAVEATVKAALLALGIKAV